MALTCLAILLRLFQKPRVWRTVAPCIATLLAVAGMLAFSSPAMAAEMSCIENRLGKSTSAYLHSARCQPVDWHEFGPEAFALAKAQSKPILLDIGAVWCHWCHVMDRESYENIEIATLINTHFIAIKVDRDARPDIDRRYQRVIMALTGRGGWPLTAFLAPDGRVFYGGTYFPPDDRGGLPGLRRLLPRIATVFQQQKDRVLDTAKNLHQQIQQADRDRQQPGDLGTEPVNRVWQALRGSFDSTYGGFGASPKFPMPSASEFALYRAYEHQDDEALRMATLSLEGMANGGINDHLGGGIHRYSVDAAWRVPHYEKLSDVNAALLRLYLHGYQSTGNPLYADVARGIAGYALERLANRQQGGFASTQDADVSMDDDGSYYTWRRAELHDALTPSERRLAGLHFGLDLAAPHRDEQERQPLRVKQRAAKIAVQLAKPEPEVAAALHAMKKKLLGERNRRHAPFIDRQQFVNWNGMLITAFLEAGIVLGEPRYHEFAVKSFELIVRSSYRDGAGFSHQVGAAPGSQSALLDDQVQMLNAALLAYQITGAQRYLQIAEATFQFIWKHFWDDSGGGFFDRQADPKALAILGARLKHLVDTSTSAANPLAANVFLDLWMLTYNDRYYRAAEATLKAFAGSTAQFGSPNMASYALALSRYLNPPTQAVIIGKPQAPLTRLLHRTALKTYRPGKLVRTHAPDAPNLPYPAKEDGMPVAYVCTKLSCAPPTSDPAKLAELVRTYPASAGDSGKTEYSASPSGQSSPAKTGK